MSDNDIHSLVQCRMEQAQEALEAAKLLLRANMCRQSAGLAYYAMFYAVTALLALRQLGTSKHAGALALFDREFVKKSVLGKNTRGVCTSCSTSVSVRTIVTCSRFPTSEPSSPLPLPRSLLTRSPRICVLERKDD